MTLDLDDERGRRTEQCPACETDYLCVTGFALRDGVAVGVYYAALHGHADAHETWIDVTLAEDPDPAAGRPRVTFGARIGDFGSHGGLGAELTDGGLDHDDPRVYGRRLTASEALADRRLDEFWEVVDFVLVADPDVQARTHA